MIDVRKRIVEMFNDGIGICAIWICCKLIPRIPLNVSYTVARIFSKLSLKLLKRKKNAILGNLDVAFGGRVSKEEKMEIAREMVTNFFKNFFECFYLASNFRNKIDHLVTIEGSEQLHKALARGKGVIALSAHFGNYALLGAVMVKEKYPFHMVIRHSRSKPVARMFQKFRDVSGHKTIPTQPWRDCVKKILNCLKNNEIVCLITDENKRRGGVNVDFFGKETATATGPAVFSLRTGAPIIPVFMVRQQDNNHKIIIDPPLEFTLTGNHNKDVHHITSRCTECIESYVKAYPTQWFWLNRRWKGLSPGDKHAQGYFQK